MVQPQLVGAALGDGLAACKAEGLGQVQVFLDAGQVQALLPQGGGLLQNAGDPGGKAAEGREVEQKLGSRQILGNGQLDQIEVGDAVAGQRQQGIHGAGAGVNPLPAVDEGGVQPQGALVEVVHPVFQAEDPDVLGQMDGFRLVPDILNFLFVGGFFLPVEEAPLVDPAADKEAGRCGEGDHQNQQGVQSRHQGQINQEPRHIQQQLGQGFPDVFCGMGVGGAGLFGLFKQPEDGRVPGVGVGSGAGFVVDGVDDIHPHIHPAEHSVLLHIALQAVQQDQGQGKASDGAQQLGQRGVLLHPGQHHGGNQQLGQIEGQGQTCRGQAEPEDAFAAVPGPAHHEPDVLPDTVGRLLFCFFHVLHLTPTV